MDMAPEQDKVWFSFKDATNLDTWQVLPLQHSEWEQIIVFETPEFYHRSPNSSEVQYTSRGMKKTI